MKQYWLAIAVALVASRSDACPFGRLVRSPAYLQARGLRIDLGGAGKFSVPRFIIDQADLEGMPAKAAVLERSWSVSGSEKDLKSDATRVLYAAEGQHSIRNPGGPPAAFRLTREGRVPMWPETESIRELFATVISDVERRRAAGKGGQQIDTVEEQLPGIYDQIELLGSPPDSAAAYRLYSFDTLGRDAAFQRLFFSERGEKPTLSLRRVVHSPQAFLRTNSAPGRITVSQLSEKFAQFSGVMPVVSEVEKTIAHYPGGQDRRVNSVLKELAASIYERLEPGSSREHEGHVKSVLKNYEETGILKDHFVEELGLQIRSQLAPHFDDSILTPKDGSIGWRMDDLAQTAEAVNRSPLIEKVSAVKDIPTAQKFAAALAASKNLPPGGAHPTVILQAANALAKKLEAGNLLDGTLIRLFDVPIQLGITKVEGRDYSITLYATIGNHVEVGPKGELKWRWSAIDASFLEGAVVTEAHLGVRPLDSSDDSARTAAKLVNYLQNGLKY